MSSLFKRVRLDFVFVIFLISLLGSSQQSNAKTLVKIADHVPGSLIVKLRTPNPSKGIQAQAISSIMKKLGSESVLSVSPFLTDATLNVVHLSQATDDAVSSAIEALKSEPGVQYAEPNYTLRVLDDGIPNDPDFDKSWGLHNTGQVDPGGFSGLAGADMNILPVWKEGTTGSQKILVAVIDTGIDWTHPDLQANIYTNPGEIDGNGLDNDHNGFVQDIHGWNFHDNNNNSMDDHNHGTHCAGIIGALGNNGVGIAGVNWNVSLLPVKFLGADGGGNLDRAVDAINYARMMKANVMSNSWGGGAFSQAMADAIQSARDAGSLFVVAAGNDGYDNDATPTYPASYTSDNVLTVGAFDNKSNLASFSNFGAKSVHVAAPGVRIWSTIRDGKYTSMSGTSMATPFASGLAALLLSVNPDMSPSDIRDRLVRTSDPVPSFKGKIVSGGKLNAYNALHDASSIR
jgi:thermitase